MNSHSAIMLPGVLALLLATPCHAGLAGCDNFNDNSIDASRWSGPVVFSGTGLLTETNQRLEFTSTGSADDICLLQWALNPGGDTQDWELKVDLNIGMPVFTNASQNVHLNLLVSPGTNISPDNFFSIEFGKDQFAYLHCELASSSGRVVLAHTNTTASNLSLRISFDSALKTLSAYVDEDAANCGYSWKPMGSAVVPADWGMTSNEFSAVLLGIAQNVAVASTNNVFCDNFRAASGPTPGLHIARQGDDVAMTWPTNAPDFQLESTTSLAAPICWSAVANEVTTIGTNFTVIDPISVQTRFFRLSRIYDCR